MRPYLVRVERLTVVFGKLGLHPKVTHVEPILVLVLEPTAVDVRDVG